MPWVVAAAEMPLRVRRCDCVAPRAWAVFDKKEVNIREEMEDEERGTGNRHQRSSHLHNHDEDGATAPCFAAAPSHAGRCLGCIEEGPLSHILQQRSAILTLCAESVDCS